MSSAWHGIHLSHKKSVKYSCHRKLLCELSKLSKFNAFNLLGYQTNTDASILVFKFLPKWTGFNMYVEYSRPQLTFLPLHAWLKQDIAYMYGKMLRTGILGYCVHYKYTRILFKGISTILFFFTLSLHSSSFECFWIYPGSNQK